MKKILVPTDFSENAWDALMYATKLYSDINCTFYIVNTYDAVIMGSYQATQGFTDTQLLETLKEESINELNKIKGFLDKSILNNKHQFKVLSKMGSLTVIAKEIINEEKIDIIIMGTTGASGLKKYLLGSNTVDMMSAIKNCPILAVPKDYEFKELEKIDFATNLKYLYTKEALDVVTELLDLHDLGIEILHVKKEKSLSEHQEIGLANLKDQFKDYDFKFKEIQYPTSSIADSITSYCRDQQVDIICLPNYEHSLFEKLTHEPVLKNVGFHAEAPLLVMSI